MATASPLLLLPPELRNRIYDVYFSLESLTAPQSVSRSYFSLSISCRQLYNETITLAFAATTFRTTSWRLSHLQHKLQTVRAELRPLIKRLEVSVDFTEFMSRRRTLDGLDFSPVGLSGLEELSIVFNKGPRMSWQETYVLRNMETLLCKTVVRCGNDRLRKIRVVHNGQFFLYGISQLENGIRKRLPRIASSLPHHSWYTRRNVEKGRFSLIREPGAADEGRDVDFLLGSTVYEAEMYQEAQKKLLESRIDTLTQALRGETQMEISEDIDQEALLYELNRLSM